MSWRLKLLSLALYEKSCREKQEEKYHWHLHARENQIPPPGDWRIWLILAGRGFGKTRTGAETLRDWVQRGLCRRLCLLGHDLQDVRRVMIEGESGILSVCPPKERPCYYPSKRQLVWPNGAIATAFSAESYEQLRGPQFDGAWVDELAKFSDPQKAWDQLMLGLRLGKYPRVIVTTTPRPIPLLADIIERPDTIVSTGSTYENQKNLAPSYLDNIRQTYENTQLADQEIHGHIVQKCRASSLWSPEILKNTHNFDPLPLKWDRVVIGLDPAVSHKEHSDTTGIIVAARSGDKGYILADLTQKDTSPQGWAKRAVEAFDHYKADRIVAEVNNGGDLIESLLRTLAPHIIYKAQRATRSKIMRAQPIAALYAQSRIIHTQRFADLEKQMLNFPRSSHSPDRVDALVWTLHELFLKPRPSFRVQSV